MMRYLVLCVVIFLSDFVQGSVFSFDVDRDRPVVLIEKGPSPLIYEGTRALANEFPESGWIDFCTATLVGVNVILTAGHCVDTGEVINFYHRQSEKVFKGVCTKHPRYNPRTIYNDYALCKLSESVPEGSHFATVDKDYIVREDDSLIMQGYGRPNLVNLFWAESSVLFVRGQDIISCGDAVLGSGDSGGALFLGTEVRDDSEMRRVIGVNSRASSVCSFFNRISHGQFVSFARAYERGNGVNICGIGVNCDKERNCKEILKELEKCIGSGTNECRDYYDDFLECLEIDIDFENI